MANEHPLAHEAQTLGVADYEMDPVRLEKGVEGLVYTVGYLMFRDGTVQPIAMTNEQYVEFEKVFQRAHVSGNALHEVAQMQEWSNGIASLVPERFDDDTAQEWIISQWLKVVVQVLGAGIDLVEKAPAKLADGLDVEARTAFGDLERAVARYVGEEGRGFTVEEIFEGVYVRAAEALFRTGGVPEDAVKVSGQSLSKDPGFRAAIQDVFMRFGGRAL